MKQYILVIGGTGMLRAAIENLLHRGDTVLALARRPERVTPPAEAPGEYIPIEADWKDPEALANQIRTVLLDHGVEQRQLAGAIIWIHSPYRDSVLDRLEELLPHQAKVLQLWGSATQDPRDVMTTAEHTIRPWDTSHLVLGFHRDPHGTRWLTNQEISDRTIQAWDERDGPPTMGFSSAGQLNPWDQRP